MKIKFTQEQAKEVLVNAGLKAEIDGDSVEFGENGKAGFSSGFSSADLLITCVDSFDEACATLIKRAKQEIQSFPQ